MIRLFLNEADRREAESYYDFHNLPDSVSNGRHRIYGAIGELVFSRVHPDHERVSGYEWDFVGPHGTVEVKTKRTSYPPLPDWNCSVLETSIRHQRPDWWYFVRVEDSLQQAWLLGAISYEDFEAQARFYAQGDLDPNSSGSTVQRGAHRIIADLWTVPVSALSTTALKQQKKQDAKRGPRPGRRKDGAMNGSESEHG